MNPTRLHLAALTVLATSGAAHAALVTSNWAATGSGNWATASNWNPAVVPNNGGGNTYAVVIDPGGARLTVNLDTSPTIESLSVFGDGILSIPGGRTLTVREGPIIVDYGLFIQGSTSDLVIGKTLGGSTVTLDGEGFVQMFTDNARIYGAADTNRLVNEGMLIRGRGQIGVNLMRLTNMGEIRADAVDAYLRIDPRNGADGVINQGIMVAQKSGRLSLQDGTFNNAGGTIRAEFESRVEFSNATVTGGAVDVDGGGLLLVIGSTSTPTTFQSALTIGRSGMLQINSGALLKLAAGGSYSNAGTILLASSGSTYMRVDGGDISLTGGGEVVLNPSGNGIIDGSVDTNRLTNVDNLIHGRGAVCNDALRMTNTGSIVADQPGQYIFVNPRDGADGFVNEGEMRATDSGILRLDDGLFNNTGGLIEAEAMSTVELQNVTVTGGTLSAAANGTVRINSGTAAFQGQLVVAPTGKVVIASGTVFQLLSGGMYANTGTIRNENGTLRIVGGDVTLGGGGVVELVPNCIIDGAVDTNRLTNLDNLFVGRGSICNDLLRMTNAGTIRANQPSQVLTVNPRDGVDGFINQGVLEAVDSAILRLDDGLFTNTAGTIRADALAVVEILNSTVAGGIIEAKPLSTVKLQSSTVTGATIVAKSEGAVDLQNLTISGGAVDVMSDGVASVIASTTTTFQSALDVDPGGTLVVLNDALLRLAPGGSYLNAGVIRLQDDGGGGSARLRADGGDVTLMGGGTVELFSNGNNTIDGTQNTNKLINLDNTIRGRGNIGGNFLLIENAGMIDADQLGGPMTIDASDLASGVVNTGTIRASGIGGLTINASPFTTSGLLVAEQGSKITRTGAVTQPGGTTRVRGEIEINSGALIAQGGVVEGDGLLDTDLNNSGATIRPGFPLGSLAMEGTLTQGANATLHIEIGSSGEDRLSITGSATLAGTLVVDLVDGFEPEGGEAFTILTATSRTGTFTNVESCAPVSVSYTPTSAIVTFTSTFGGVFADLNGDGVVNAADLGILLGGWGPCTDLCCPIDLSADGQVGPDDLGLLLSAW